MYRAELTKYDKSVIVFEPKQTLAEAVEICEKEIAKNATELPLRGAYIFDSKGDIIRELCTHTDTHGELDFEPSEGGWVNYEVCDDCGEVVE